MNENISKIKKYFYTFRNGAVAESLKKTGLPHKYIFGLLLPQITEIANQLSPSKELATELWEDHDTRESRLLATYLFPKESLDIDMAFKLIKGVQSIEEAEILSFRLLRHLPFATEIIEKSKTQDLDPLPSHCIAMLSKQIP